MHENRDTWSKNSYENSRYHFEENYVKNPHLSLDRTYNRFGALNYEIECYKCHNFGHKIPEAGLQVLEISQRKISKY